MLFHRQIETPLGSIVAISDEEDLYLLEFVDRQGLQRKIEKLQLQTDLPIVSGKSFPIDLIEKELSEYFCGSLNHFKVPIKPIGSSFQRQVWFALQEIPVGTTCSYKTLASAIQKPSFARAVARANGTNPLAIIVPCHRVIRENGDLGGYTGGIERKKWLLAHEKSAFA